MPHSNQSKILTYYQPLIWFCLIGFILCAQFVFSIKVEEPYPCVRLPGFGSIPEEKDSIVITNFSIAIEFEDGTTVEYPCRKNFPTIPQWFVPYFSNNLLQRQLSNFKKQDQVLFKEWLRHQVSQKIKRDDFQSIEVRENKQVFNKSSHHIQKEVIDSKTYTF